jgi:hypothetical protein
LSPVLGIIASSNYQRVAPDTGAMFPLGMVQVGSGGSSSIDFTSIPSTFTHLQVRAMATASSSTATYFRFNSDTGSNYARHMLQGNGSSANAYAGSSQTSMWFIADINVSPYTAAAVVDILDYKNTSKYTTVRTLNGVDNNNTTGNNAIELTSGLWMNTNAVNSISIFPLSGNFQQYSQFALYGIL